MSDVTRHALTGRIIGAAIEVHRRIGPGMLESVYEECLAHELASAFKADLLLKLRRGLLINFNVPKLVDGVHSFLNG